MMESYLSEDEILYSKNEWDKFNKNDVCEIAAENGWLDLHLWSRSNKYIFHNKEIWKCAVSSGNLEILEYLLKCNCKRMN